MGKSSRSSAFRWRLRAVALVIAGSGSIASAQFGYDGPPPGPFFSDWEGGVHNDQALAGFFRAAALGRVDIVCIGDSNQLLQGRGWDEAYVKVLTRRFRLYATGLVSAGENFGNGAGVGFNYSGLFPAPGTGYVIGATGSAAIYMNAPALLQPTNAISVPVGVSVSPLANLGLIVRPESDIDTSAPLRYWVAHAVYPPGTGATLHLSARLNDPPFTEIAPPKLIDATVHAAGDGQDALGVAVSFYDIPSAGASGTPATRGAINFRPNVFGAPFTGPMTQYYARVENPLVTRGASVHTLYGFGGQSARDMGEALRAASNESLTLYFSMVRALQGPHKAVLIRIGTGVNDRSEPLPPLEPTGAPPNHPVSFAANLRAVAHRVRDIWALNNWPQDELYFLFAVSTPLSTPDDALLQAYRDAADALTLEVPRSAVTHFERLTSVPELQANDWILFDIDTAHLEAPGHEEMARRELASASMYAAWTDLNGDGLFDAEDLYSVHQHENMLRPPPGSNNGNLPPAGPYDGATNPTDPQPGWFPSTDGLEPVPQPFAPTPPALIRAVRFEEQADLAASR